ncbi:hypothetical protein D3C87_1031210 [compost metagenome]
MQGDSQKFFRAVSGFAIDAEKEIGIFFRGIAKVTFLRTKDFTCNTLIRVDDDGLIFNTGGNITVQVF